MKEKESVNEIYKGDTSYNWYHGKGVYRFRNNVIYDGNFYKGQFHGEGIMIYPNGGKYYGLWENGKLLRGKYEFSDGLEYKDSANWSYCSSIDRRFYYEIKHDIKDPDIENFCTIFINIPDGCYNCGDGYLDPDKGMIFSYNNKFLRYPNEEEEKWIKNKSVYNSIKYNDSFCNDLIKGKNDEVIKNIIDNYKFKSYNKKIL